MALSTVAAAACLLLGGLGGLAIGLVYLRRQVWMPYHEVASATRWQALGERMQLTVRTLVNVAGAGMVGTAVAGLCLLLVWWFTGQRLALLLAAVPGFAFGLPVLVFTRRLKAATGANTPVGAAAATLGLSALGLLLAAL